MLSLSSGMLAGMSKEELVAIQRLLPTFTCLYNTHLARNSTDPQPTANSTQLCGVITARSQPIPGSRHHSTNGITSFACFSFFSFSVGPFFPLSSLSLRSRLSPLRVAFDVSNLMGHRGC